MTSTPTSSNDMALGITQAYQQQKQSEDLNKAVMAIRNTAFETNDRLGKDFKTLVEALGRHTQVITAFPERFTTMADKAESRMLRMIDSLQEKVNQFTELKVDTRSMIGTRLWIHTILFSILSSVVVAVTFSLLEPLHIQRKKDAQTWSHFQTKVFPKLDLDTQRKITRTWDSSETK